MFDAIEAASSGSTLAQTMLDAISDNVSNSETVRPAGQEPYRAKLVVATARTGTEGVSVSGITERGGEAPRVYDPTNPMADADGYVTHAQVDMTEEMSNLVVAQRLYQANANVAKIAGESYQSALQIGVK
jgi:flagellar basal-body rod protein FlgC